MKVQGRCRYGAVDKYYYKTPGGEEIWRAEKFKGLGNIVQADGRVPGVMLDSKSLSNEVELFTQ
jgi:hypothetical protein